MGVYIRGGWYWYKRQLDRRRYYRPLKVRRDQKSLLSSRLAQVEEEVLALHYGLDSPVRGSSVTFTEFRKRYLAAKRDKDTLERDRQRLEYIGRLLPDLPLNLYTPQHFRELEASLFKANGLGRPSRPATVNRYMELLRGFFNVAIKEKVLKENPLAGYEPHAEDATRRALNDDEIRAILDAARRIKTLRNNPLGRVFPDMLLFGLATGQRLSEVLTFRRSWIVEPGLALVPITSTKSRKRGANLKQRVRPVVLSKLAQEIIRRQPHKDDFVFELRRRVPGVVQRAVESVCRETGIEEFSFHYLRHSTSTFVASHSSLKTAQLVLGQKDLSTTSRYTHPDLAEQRSAVTKMETRLRRIISK